ncbi:dihydroxyacetone kinase family protein [Pseudomonas sp. NPDC007930]|uniref:dihydroxyacetone kinase family protein n=1 Tax=Pseudomonas sp. NPDC007930 TaxID=3364417 RepID=UPI0036EFA635
MKKLINDPAQVVEDMLEGLALSDARITLLEGENIAVRSDLPAGSVSLISGGGAGHEPAHAGYVGAGMLSAAVAGPVFTSPSVDAVLAAIMSVAGPAGVLLIVKNYTGDRLNFGLAAEIARAAGVQVEMLVVGDDVALDQHAGAVGRRGIAGTVLVHKIAGAAAEAGLPLAQVLAAAQRAADGLFSMGLGLSACTVPAAGKPGFSLEDGEVEYGLGIHGESGVRRAPLGTAREMVGQLVERIASQGELRAGDRVALLVNNLGGSAAQDLDIVTREALLALYAKGLKVEAASTGTFLTALEMAGCSLSVLKLDDALLEHLRAPTAAPAWKPMATPVAAVQRRPATHLGKVAAVEGRSWSAAHAARFKAALEGAAASLIAAEATLTELDSVVGDGDLGISLARGAKALQQEMGSLALDRPTLALQQVSALLRRVLGGTSGPLHAVFMLRAGVTLAAAKSPYSLRAWASAFEAGCDGVAELGGAKPGERTLLDALWPAARALREVPGDTEPAEAAMVMIGAALEGAQATKAMRPVKGRSAYLGDRALGHMDPGAFAVVVWIKGVMEGLAGK